jgi:peptide/nickel transport system permease protein
MAAQYLLKRAWHAVIVVFVVVCVSFLLLHAAPGDPISASRSESTISPAALAALKAAYGLDRPLGEQFVRYLGQVAQGNLGHSTIAAGRVTDAIASAIPNTLRLMGVAIALSIGIGVTTGVVQAARRGTAVDRTLSATTLFFHSMPEFWLATLLFLSLTYWLPVFPTGGVMDVAMYSVMTPAERVLDRLYHLVLPVATLVLLTAALIARYQRSAMLDVLGSDYIRSALARGVSRSSALFHHALRNALIPTITLIGLAFPALLGGAVFIESVFAWPGMGLLALKAVEARDYWLILGIVIVSSVMVSIGSLIADVLHVLADPRMRKAQ